MKASLVLNFCIVLPLILFVDYLIMVLIGCSSCLFSFDDDFNCDSYCIVGKIILGISAVFFLFLIFPDLKKMYLRK